MVLGQSGPLLSPFGAARRCAVLGSPVAHSLSPLLHRAAYAALGLDWTYQACRVDQRRLPGFLAALPTDWRGLSLTRPLKRSAVGLVDTLGPEAAVVGAVNTLLLEGGRRIGHNTDVSGLVEALRAGGVSEVSNACLLGAGATAASALVALSELGARQVEVWARDPARVEGLLAVGEILGVPIAVHLLGREPLPATDVVVSTIPAAAAAPLAEQVVERAAVVFDVVYDPWPTPLVTTATQAGRAVLNGLDLLVTQAARQVELMTGLAPAPLAAMRAALDVAADAPSTDLDPGSPSGAVPG